MQYPARKLLTQADRAITAAKDHLHTSVHTVLRDRAPGCRYAAYGVWLAEGEPLDCVCEIESLVCERRHVMDVHAALLVGVASGKVEVASHLVHL